MSRLKGALRQMALRPGLAAIILITPAATGVLVLVLFAAAHVPARRAAATAPLDALRYE